MSERIPEIPDDVPEPKKELVKKRFDTQVDSWKAQQDLVREKDKADQAATIAEQKAQQDLVRETDKARQAADIILEKLELDLDYELLKTFHATIVETA